MSNRKLIRPNLQEIKDKMTTENKPSQPRQPAVTRQSAGITEATQPLLSHPLLTTARRKQAPPEQTYAENFYYLKQMTSKVPMVIFLENGEEIRGIIEWYDKNCLKVNRNKEPNLLIMKSKIKYMYKQEEETRQMKRNRKNASRSESDVFDE